MAPTYTLDLINTSGLIRHILRQGLRVLAALLLAALALAPAAAQEVKTLFLHAQTILDREAPFRRLLWVTRWDYRTPDDIEKIYYNAASARFTDVLFQVRGEGTAFYASGLEPWAGELTGDNAYATVGKSPGWDPLAVAVAQGRKRGLRTHAYLNVLPGWGNPQSPPVDSGQLFTAHRSWFMVDTKGRNTMAKKGYLFLDPALPEVRRYLAELFQQVASNYDLDGIHLDYIRYPFDYGEYSYHPRALEAFKALTGATPAKAPGQWDDFRRQQITDVVRIIRQATRSVRPTLELSAAVIADAEKSHDEAFQSPIQWLKDDLVDDVAPMAYAGDMDRFDELAKPYLDPSIVNRVWMGIWGNPDRNKLMNPQIERTLDAGCPNVAVFAYSYLFPGHKPSTRAVGVYKTFMKKAGKPS